MTRRRGRRGRKGLNLPKNGKQIVLVGKGKKSVGDSRFKVFFATFLASLSAHKRKGGGAWGQKSFSTLNTHRLVAGLILPIFLGAEK